MWRSPADDVLTSWDDGDPPGWESVDDALTLGSDGDCSFPILEAGLKAESFHTLPLCPTGVPDVDLSGVRVA